MSAATLALLALFAVPALGQPPDSVLLATCAPQVHLATLRAVIAVESGGDPLAVNVNGGPRVRPRSVAEAVRVARAAIRHGYSVDLGLMQVNSRNLALLGTTVPAMFDPCANVRAGATLLADGYTAAARRHGEGQAALRAALSAYNTGDFARGFRNGYVARYYGRSGRGRAPGYAGGAPQVAADPYAAPTTVFSRAARVTRLAEAPALVFNAPPSAARNLNPQQAPDADREPR